jgi:hypothetical protein
MLHRGPYLTTNVVGGLGNQLFLMANLLSCASRHRSVLPNLQVIVPRVSSSDSCGPPRPVYWDSVFQNLSSSASGVQLVQSLPLGCQTVVVPERRPVVPVTLPYEQHRHHHDMIYSLTGFFQSHLYFGGGGDNGQTDTPSVNGGDALLSLLPAHYRPAAQVHLHLNYLPPAGSAPERCHTVGVHVRRGDYLTMRDVFPILEFDYYDAALRTLLGPALYKAPYALSPRKPPSTVEAAAPTTSDVLFPSSPVHQHTRVLVFSEDAPYADALVGTWRVKYPGVFVTHVDPKHEVLSSVENSFSAAQEVVGPSPPPRDVVELLMLSLCDDLIIANSSFSWWAAYWNRCHGRRVVAPTKWFVADPFPSAAHLYPEGWILL